MQALENMLLDQDQARKTSISKFKYSNAGRTALKKNIDHSVLCCLSVEW